MNELFFMDCTLKKGRTRYARARHRRDFTAQPIYLTSRSDDEWCVNGCLSVQGRAKKKLLSCEKVLPVCAWPVLSKTGPFFCTSLYWQAKILKMCKMSSPIMFRNSIRSSLFHFAYTTYRHFKVRDL